MIPVHTFLRSVRGTLDERNANKAVDSTQNKRTVNRLDEVLERENVSLTHVTDAESLPLGNGSEIHWSESGTLILWPEYFIMLR